MPVTTFSCSPSTQCIPGVWSKAATKCISLVPGLAKQVSTPESSRVRTRLFAPFIVDTPLVGERCPLSADAGHAAVRPSVAHGLAITPRIGRRHVARLRALDQLRCAELKAVPCCNRHIVAPSAQCRGNLRIDIAFEAHAVRVHAKAR